MLKKLELDTLNAEISSLDFLISERVDDDPIGASQFLKRKNKLLEKVAAIQDNASALASVGLFFGGSPVFGSKGIDSHFASSILNIFQAIVNKRYAFLENGALSSRGPIPNSNNAKLMITDVARGSFGFILEENPKEVLADVETELKHVVDDVSGILAKISSADENIFTEVFEELDDRTLIDVRAFYEELASAKATLKIVDNENEYVLTADRINIAKGRMESVSISEEREFDVVGKLYLLPSDKRFEIQVAGEDAPLRGRVSKGFIEAHSLSLDSLVGSEASFRLTARDMFKDGMIINTKYILESIN